MPRLLAERGDVIAGGRRGLMGALIPVTCGRCGASGTDLKTVEEPGQPRLQICAWWNKWDRGVCTFRELC